MRLRHVYDGNLGSIDDSNFVDLSLDLLDDVFLLHLYSNYYNFQHTAFH